MNLTCDNTHKRGITKVSCDSDIVTIENDLVSYRYNLYPNFYILPDSALINESESALPEATINIDGDRYMAGGHTRSGNRFYVDDYTVSPVFNDNGEIFGLDTVFFFINNSFKGIALLLTIRLYDGAGKSERSLVIENRTNHVVVVE